MSAGWSVEFSPDYYLRSLELCIRDPRFRLVTEGNWWKAVFIDLNFENIDYHLLVQRLHVLLRNKGITLFSLEALLSAIDEKKITGNKKKRKDILVWDETLFITQIRESILDKIFALRNNR